MTKEQKTATIAELKEKFAASRYFYVTDTSTMTVEKVNQLRRHCFEQNVELRVVKNTLIRKALEQVAEEKNESYDGLYAELKGMSALMFSETGNAPARLIKKFREDVDPDRPLLKVAYIESDIVVGDDQVESLTKLKSKEELIADVILLLESPIKNVLGSLQSGGNTIAGLLKALEERGGEE